MNYRNVGKSGLKVSEIAVGSWMTDLVGSKKVDIARDTIKLAYENGINFFDCADAYSGGEARYLMNIRDTAMLFRVKFFSRQAAVQMTGDCRENIFLRMLTVPFQI